MARKVLVTGGSGFIGSGIVRGLLHRGYSVRVLDDNSRGSPRRLKDVMDDIEFVVGDVRDVDTVDRATQGVDVIAHLAFVNGTEHFYTNPKLVLEVGVKGSINTLESAVRHGVSEYWYMSSSEVYQTAPQVPTDESAPFFIPDPLNPRYSYAGGKIAGELLAINYGRDRFDRAIIVRPHNVFGPDMGFEHVIPQFIVRAVERIEASDENPMPFPIQGDGTQTRAFVYIDDFVDGGLLAFTQGEKLGIYHVGTMDERSIEDVARTVVGHLGREINLQPGEPLKGGTYRRCPDIAKVTSLGYVPKVAFDKGIQLTMNWYIRNQELWPAR